MPNLDARECTTHHHACDCREAKFAALEAENERLRRILEYTVGKLGHQANCNYCRMDGAGKPCSCDIAEAVTILERKEAHWRKRTNGYEHG